MSRQNTNWEDIFARYKASGLTQTAFCKQDNVAFNKFQYRWSKKTQAAKLGAEADVKKKSIKNSFEPITLSSLPSIVATKGSNVIELSIHLPNKIRCEVKIDSDANGLSMLLKELVSLC